MPTWGGELMYLVVYVFAESWGISGKIFLSHQRLLRETQSWHIISFDWKRQLQLYGYVARFLEADLAHRVLSVRDSPGWRRPRGRPRGSGKSTDSIQPQCTGSVNFLTYTHIYWLNFDHIQVEHLLLETFSNTVKYIYWLYFVLVLQLTNNSLFNHIDTVIKLVRI